MKIKKIDFLLQKFAILLIPFEAFGHSIGQSFWSPSYIVLLISFLVCFLNRKIFSKKAFLSILTVTIYLLVLNGLFAYGELDTQRYFRSTIAILILVFVCTKNFFITKDIDIDRKKMFSYFRWSIFLCCLFIYIHLFLVKILNIDYLSYSMFLNIRSVPGRYQGFMVEPSYAGYVIAPLLAYEIFVFFMCLKNFKLKDIVYKLLFIFFLMMALYLTFSVHIFTVIITLIIVLIIEHKKILLELYLAFKKRFFIGILMTTVLFVIGRVYISSDHIQNRISVNQTQNISTIAWLRGYENVLTTLNNNPWFGYGLGNNYRAFEDSSYMSNNQEFLIEVNLSDLTKHDSFSMLFRLISEGGIVLIIFLLYLITRALQNSITNKSDMKLQNIEKITNKDILNLKSQDFLYIMFISACLGALLKEPSYYNYLIPLTILFL